MSIDTSSANSKRAALEQLRFTKFNKARVVPNDTASLSTSVSSNKPLDSFPPPQSRDATVPSRFFPSASQSDGIILVPSSSPLKPGFDCHTLQQCQPLCEQDMTTIPNAIHSNHFNPWGHSKTPATVDPLTMSSGFLIENGGHRVSSRHPRDGNGKHDQVVTEEGPPRKRANYGLSQSPSSNLSSPGSPEVRRPGARQRKASGMDTFSMSSDESLSDIQDISNGLPKSRIMRGRRFDSPSPTSMELAHSESEDANFTRFLVTMPLHSPSRVRTAWHQANGDVREATVLLSDPGWDPDTLVSHFSSEGVGRVKEIDEATKAERAAAKEKGKKSMIYANRSVLDNRTSRTSTPATIDLTASSPVTPINTRPRYKTKMKVVIDSDSELELNDSEGGEIDISTSSSSGVGQALQYFNTADPEALQELTGCTLKQANGIIERRPFLSARDLNTKLGQGKKKAGPAGISPRIFDDCTAIFEGYDAVDSILEGCEEIGAMLRQAISSWTSTCEAGTGKIKGADSLVNSEDGSLSLLFLTPSNDQKSKDYLVTQPALLSHDVQLKEYQLLGVNWLQLLYRRNLSCILADEMGLGKTIQVISFLALLKEQGSKGPHLVVVPSSTLENWCREFARFAPSISVQTYYASKGDRPLLRQTLLETRLNSSKNGEGWEVLITTYNLAQGDDRDRKFFRRVQWDVCVFDEGHVLKNFQSQRYQALLRFGSNWRLLLTGTPLQNNLQELVSLMNFILPSHFAQALGSLHAIFKVKGDSKVTLLSQERVSRAKKMMTPFVLRRRKDQVLKDLPKRTERIEWCDMTELQRTLYTDTLRRSRKAILDIAIDTNPETRSSNQKGKQQRNNNVPTKDKEHIENSSNVLMDLRKAALHPMLFRTLFTDRTLTDITKQLMKEADFKKRKANFDFVKEDMEVMTDAELQLFCATYKSTRKYLQDGSCYLDAGKVIALLHLLEQYSKEGRKVLIFSQFTQVLDILQAILKQREIKYLLLTGSTAVDVRQSLVDEFTDDECIPVFLLSTKAGGMGINLTAASVVIMFDQDFNPHNDKQAQDRAYRIGQKRDVEVVKLITRGTIEEDMLKLGETKLALDEAVAGDNEGTKEKKDNAYETEMKMSLMNVLRKQFTSEHGNCATEG